MDLALLAALLASHTSYIYIFKQYDVAFLTAFLVSHAHVRAHTQMSLFSLIAFYYTSFTTTSFLPHF